MGKGWHRASIGRHNRYVDAYRQCRGLKTCAQMLIGSSHTTVYEGSIPSAPSYKSMGAMGNWLTRCKKAIRRALSAWVTPIKIK
jgi:hypothetical protein